MTAFTAEWHRENLCLDLPPFRHLAERFQPASVLDLGCGLGGYLKLFADCGAETVIGVDGFPIGGQFLSPGRYVQHDLGQPVDLGATFDIVMCMEVIEHVAPEHEDVLLDNIFRHARELIAFSAAEVNQPGHGHINCRPISHWLDKFLERGWAPRSLDTLAMRTLATFPWFRRNSVVFARGVDSGSDIRGELIARGQVPFNWPNQKRVVVGFPLWELVNR